MMYINAESGCKEGETIVVGCEEQTGARIQLLQWWWGNISAETRLKCFHLIIVQESFGAILSVSVRCLMCSSLCLYNAQSLNWTNKQ